MNRKEFKVNFDLSDVLQILKSSDRQKIYDAKKVRPSFLDYFLYSGRFNSVLGPEGFQAFKDKLKDVVKKVNQDDFGANYINLDAMYQTLLSSGVYYMEKYLPAELEFLKKDERWLTAYRYVAKNFPDLDYRDFRELVKRFEETGGHSTYVCPEDSKGLLEVAKHTELFTETVDVKAALLQLSQKELRAICDQCGAKGARSSAETVDRIMASVGDSAAKYLPESVKSRVSLVIGDVDLATGQDIIHLDSYLRTVAKVVREDLVEFINKQRHGTLVA